MEEILKCENTVILDSGGYSLVYKGVFRNQEVAIKVLNLHKFDKINVFCNFRMFIKEIIVMAQTQSDFVIKIVAYSYQRYLCMLTQLMPASLHNLIYEPQYKTTTEQKLRLAKQIAIGVKDLHNVNIIHRDLKPKNVLLDKEGNIKIIDFGISELTFHIFQRVLCPKTVGSLPYMPPESFSEESILETNFDTWSFGCLLYEFFMKKRL